jgi:leucyl-tRNA synthetase
MKGVEGVYRFLCRAWRMIVDAEADIVRVDARVKPVELTHEQAKIVARSIATVTDDLDGYRFNTAISRLMEFVNFFTSQEVRPTRAMETFALLLAPMAPHMAEELWSLLGHEKTLAFETWPTFDPALLKDAQVEVPVQINGKLRGRVVVAAEAGGQEIEQTARDDPKIAELLAGKTVKKVVVVPGKLVNFVVG